MGMNLAIVLFAYGGFFREGFSADSITQKIWPMVNIDAWVMNGRFLAYLTGWGLDRVGINPMYHYKVFYLLFILLVALSMTILQNALCPVLLSSDGERDVWERPALCLILALIHINGLFCESFMFPECFLIFGLSHLFCALAVDALFSKKRRLITALCLFVAALFYQAPLITTLIVMIAVLFVQSVRDGAGILYPVKRMGIWCVYTIALILVTVRVGAFADRMRGGILSKGVNVTDAGNAVSELVRYFMLFNKSGMGLLPPVFLPAVAFLVPFFMYRRRSSILSYLAVFCVMLGLSFSIVAANGMQGVSGRLLGGLYATQAMMLCMAYALRENMVHRKVLAGFGVFYLVVQIVFCNMIMMNHYISNDKDLAYAEAVYDQIRYYEEVSGQTVTSVAYTQDAACYDSYDTVYYKFGEINSRCIHRTGWILLSYVARDDGREFALTSMDAAIAEAHFAGRDWNTFRPQEQLVFEGDTLYWCVY